MAVLDGSVPRVSHSLPDLSLGAIAPCRARPMQRLSAGSTRQDARALIGLPVASDRLAPGRGGRSVLLGARADRRLRCLEVHHGVLQGP